MRIRSLFPMFIGLVLSSSLSAGTASWEAILADPDGLAKPLAVPSNVPGGNVVISPGDSTFMGTAITPDGTKALIACTTEVDVLDLTQPIITVTSVTGFTQAIGIAITPDGTRALVTDNPTDGVAVLDLLSSPISIESWVFSWRRSNGRCHRSQRRQGSRGA